MIWIRIPNDGERPALALLRIPSLLNTYDVVLNPTFENLRLMKCFRRTEKSLKAGDGMGGMQPIVVCSRGLYIGKYPPP
jgi:hypothetical protein